MSSTMSSTMSEVPEIYLESTIMNELSDKERLARLEGKVSEIEQQVRGTFSSASGVSTQGHVQVLTGLGGSDPNAKAPPRRRSEDRGTAGTTMFSGYQPKEPRRPVPKKQNQSTYGWSYRRGAFVALNFAEHCAFYFTGVKNRLRSFSKLNDKNAMLYAYACVVIKKINTEIYEKDVDIDTRKIMKAHDELIDLLRGHGTRGNEIVKSLEYMDKVRNLFEQWNR